MSTIQKHWNGISTRWTSNNATIFFYSNEKDKVNLTFKAISFYNPRDLEIYSGNAFIIRQTIPSLNTLSPLDSQPPSFAEVSVQIPLKPGLNSIRLYVPEGGYCPVEIPELHNSDTRRLSIAIQNLTIS